MSILMLSLNSLLAIGLLLITTPNIDAAALRPVSSAQPIVSATHRGIGLINPPGFRDYHDNVIPDTGSVRNIKGDFNSADRWKKQLRNKDGLPIPKVVTYAPEITFAARSIATQRPNADEETYHHIRRHHSYNYLDGLPIPFPTFTPRQSAQHPSQQDEDDARLAEYEAFKSEMKQIPDDAGISRSEGGPSWIISQRRLEKTMEAQAQAVANSVEETSDDSFHGNDETAETRQQFIGTDEADEVDQQATGEDGTNVYDSPRMSHERTQMDAAEEVLDQFSLVRGPLHNNDKVHKKRHEDPLRLKMMICNGVTSAEHPNVEDHRSPAHKYYCRNKVLDCGQHCYRPGVLSVKGVLRTYDPPKVADHPSMESTQTEAVHDEPLAPPSLLIPEVSSSILLPVASSDLKSPKSSQESVENLPTQTSSNQSSSPAIKLQETSMGASSPTWPPSVTSLFGGLGPGEEIEVVSQRVLEDGAVVRILKKVMKDDSHFSSTPEINFPSRDLSHELQKRNALADPARTLKRKSYQIKNHVDLPGSPNELYGRYPEAPTCADDVRYHLNHRTRTIIQEPSQIEAVERANARDPSWSPSEISKSLAAQLSDAGTPDTFGKR